MSTGCQIGGNDSLFEGRQTNYHMQYTLLTHDSVVLLINYDVITIVTIVCLEYRTIELLCVIKCDILY